MYAPTKLLASAGPRAEGVPTNNQREQGSWYEARKHTPSKIEIPLDFKNSKSESEKWQVLDTLVSISKTSP